MTFVPCTKAESLVITGRLCTDTMVENRSFSCFSCIHKHSVIISAQNLHVQSLNFKHDTFWANLACVPYDCYTYGRVIRKVDNAPLLILMMRGRGWVNMKGHENEGVSRVLLFRQKPLNFLICMVFLRSLPEGRPAAPQDQ